jgi:hypothetical protein
MITDLDETLRQLLIAEMPVKNGEVDIKFDLPKREWSSRLSKPTVNLFLYDVRENNVLRQHQWEQTANGRRNDNLAHLKRTPFRVDCFYMLTTWANDPDDEHRLLTRALLALFRFPVLPEDRLVGTLRNPTFEIQARLAVHDRLTNPAEVWSALDNEMRPSVPYIVTLALDPWTEVTGPLVSTLTLRTGQTNTLPHARALVAGTQVDLCFIGGVVRRKEGDKGTLAGVEVAVKGTGLFAKTDDRGRFGLGSLPPGPYTLVAWPAKGRPVEKAIQVPGASDEYDLAL